MEAAAITFRLIFHVIAVLCLAHCSCIEAWVLVLPGTRMNSRFHHRQSIHRLFSCPPVGDSSINHKKMIPQQQWQEIRIADSCIISSENNRTSNYGATFLEGDSVILLPSLLKNTECEEILVGARKCAEAHCIANNLISPNSANQQDDHSHEPVKKKIFYGLVRLPTTGAALRARQRNTPCAEALDQTTNALVIKALTRVLQRVDSTLTDIRQSLFPCEGILKLLQSDQLVYASREPGVNVYTPPGGQFLAHTDGQALTVLINLSSSPADFKGGGTAFWPQDARGHRVEPPSLVLKPPRGSAILFVGSVTHAGLPVTQGERVVAVASFSARRQSTYYRTI